MVQFKIESWIWYGFGVFIVACRLLSRGLFFKSIRKFQIDDWLMVVALCTDTVFIVAINICAHTSSNLLAPGDNVNQFTPQERAERIYGSKIVLVVEQMQCCTVWLIKACLLLLYNRLTYQLSHNIAVKILAAYVALGFVLMEILYFGVWCRPFHNYWALPTPNPQCDAATNHLITNATFNISSDIIMLIIGFSLFGPSHLPWNRKALIFGIFGLGMFVILAAILNKYYSFTHPFGSQWTYWYVRESSTAIIVANLPFIWTLLRRIFNLKSFDHTTSPPIPWHSSRTARGRGAGPRRSGAMSSQQTSSQQTKRAGESSLITSAFARGSDSLKSETCDAHVHVNGKAPAPAPTPAQPLETSAYHPPWRKQSVYGRADLDAITTGSWDNENGTKSDGLPSAQESRTASIQSKESASLSPSWYSNHKRRIKDEEAQWKVQDALRYKYQGIDEE